MSTHCHESQSTSGRHGLPFHDTTVLHPVLTLAGDCLLPEILASIPNAFSQIDQKWICYRRNFFAVQCSVTFRNGVANGPFFLSSDGFPELIQQFAVSIKAKTVWADADVILKPVNSIKDETASTSNEEREAQDLIVQHTSKRDKATMSIPGRHLIAPSPNHGIGTDGTYTSAFHVYGALDSLHSGMIGAFPSFGSPGTNSIPTCYTFDRLQFRKSTAHNGKRHKMQERFIVVVELSANIGMFGDENWVVIATKDSDRIMARGRSPGHFKEDESPDSEPSMDPDRETGHGTDGHEVQATTGPPILP
ncbi:hypothetical protein AYL99_11695 [Fonsecaea erecta]|uniref:NDT80 domain-containing protein n=1 Tax=Fonsecaea erecta TaxID=1367422 RepID=A0A178Z318_9EURO|nr:hypothetical protein AYL99_11695 [Fonsecaea erecta]OAP54160.1 hypothetical protein AYL99_11695 [Fonsecaea erecta]